MWFGMKIIRLICVLVFMGLPFLTYARALVTEDEGASWHSWGPNQETAVVAQSVEGRAYAGAFDGKVFRLASKGAAWELLFESGDRKNNYSFPDVIIPLIGSSERLLYGAYNGPRQGFWLYDVNSKTFQKLVDGAAMWASLLDDGQTLLLTTWSKRYMIKLSQPIDVQTVYKDRYSCFNPNNSNETSTTVRHAGSYIKPGKREIKHSTDGGKTFSNTMVLNISELVQGYDLGVCAIPPWNLKGTIYALGVGKGTGFFLTKNFGKDWKWVRVDAKRKDFQQDWLYFHPSIVGKSYLLSNRLNALYIVEGFGDVKKKHSSIPRDAGENIRGLSIDPLDSKRLILIVTPFHDL